MTGAPTVAPTDVSIVVPTYRRPERLGRALAALARLPGAAAVEIVVCDDGSPAADAAAYERVAAESRLNVRLVRQENGGPGAARNAAGQQARGALLLFTDDDCLPSSGFIEQHIRGRAHGERIAVQGHVAFEPHTRLTPFMEMV